MCGEKAFRALHIIFQCDGQYKKDEMALLILL